MILSVPLNGNERTEDEVNERSRLITPLVFTYKDKILSYTCKLRTYIFNKYLVDNISRNNVVACTQIYIYVVKMKDNYCNWINTYIHK